MIDRLGILLADSTGTIAVHLLPIHQAQIGVERPAAMLAQLHDNPTAQGLARPAADRRAPTHQLVDELGGAVPFDTVVFHSPILAGFRANEGARTRSAVG